MGAIKFQIEIEDEKAQRAMLRMVAKQGRMQDGFRKTAKEADATFGDAAVAKLLKYGAGFVGIRMAMAQLRREYENLLNIQKKSADAQISLASARRDIIRNMAGATEDQRVGVEGFVKTLARRARVSETTTAGAFAEAISAGGGITHLEDIKRSMSVAVPYMSDRPGNIPLMVGAIGDIGKVRRDPRDALANLGMMSLTGTLGRVVNPQLQAANIPRALTTAVTFGATPEQGGALFAALSSGANDPQGALTAQAEMGLTRSLEREMPRVGDFNQRLQAMRARSPRRIEKFLNEKMVGVRGTMRGAIRDILTNPNSPTWKYYEEFLPQFGDAAKLHEIGANQLRALSAGQTQALAETKRAFTSMEEQVLLTDLAGAEGSVSREGLGNVLRASGVSDIATKMRLIGFEATTGFGKKSSAARAADILEERAQVLEYPNRAPGWGHVIPPTGMGMTAEVAREPTAHDLEMAELLREQVKLLRQIATHAKESADGKTGKRIQAAPAAHR